MKVTGNRIKSYVLADKVKGTDYEGAIYEATNLRKPRSMTCVKLYTPMMRTDEQMNKVINAANGMGGILGPIPIEPVYQRGKFVGYSYEESISNDVTPPSPPKQNSHGTILAAVALGVVFSLLVRFVLLKFLLNISSELAGRMLCKGAIMIFAGWAAGVFGFRMGSTSAENCIFAAIGFVAGCVVVYVATSLLAAIVLAVTMGVSMLLQVLPDLIASIVVLVILAKVAKSVFR